MRSPLDVIMLAYPEDGNSSFLATTFNNGAQTWNIFYQGCEKLQFHEFLTSLLWNGCLPRKSGPRFSKV